MHAPINSFFHLLSLLKTVHASKEEAARRFENKPGTT